MREQPELPDQLESVLEAFRRHLAAERGVSGHTVRAYLGDVRALLEYAARAGVTSPDGLDIAVLRGWLAGQHATGRARATLARRAASARTFTAFGHARGWLPSDPGPLLGTPRMRRKLPEVIRQDQMAAVLAAQDGPAPGSQPRESPAPEGSEPGPRDRALALRDTAIMELLYATGIRVSELCGLDLGDLDEERNTIRAMGKGGKERIVPVGLPAVRAVRAWLLGGGAILVGDRTANAGTPGAGPPATGRRGAGPPGAGAGRQLPLTEQAAAQPQGSRPAGPPMFLGA